MLRKAVAEDLEAFFQFQLNEEACYLAAFTPADSKDKEAYIARWGKIIAKPEVNMQAIIMNNQIVGSIIKFEMEGDAEISYWIDRDSWSKGIATQAMILFISIENTRPLFGRTAFDNIGSRKVLEKSGFRKIGTDVGFANARNKEVEEYIYKLD